ncbi:hypothetical protein [Ruegeria sp. HKCCA5929]|nr:hypothetical protein [Ruegeria sp. HKCCA5929]
MSDEDKATFEQRVKHLFDTKEDRAQAWRHENTGSFDAQRRIHRGPKDDI